MPLKFYKDEPLFGLDIGHSSLKVAQLDTAQNPCKVLGYGVNSFDPAAIQNGVISNTDAIASSLQELFDNKIVGSISSKRVACSIPTAHTFSRPMKLPVLDHDGISEAINLEAEQYIPIPLNNLYLDYEISHQDEKGVELLLVAASKSIIDSYVKLLSPLELEPIAFEPSINAASRLIKIENQSSAKPFLVIDIGSVATDIAVFDNALLVSSTLPTGGDHITNLIAKNLHLSYDQANETKNHFGISFSDKQQRIVDTIRPQLDTLVHEALKTIRYYNERATNSGKLAQVVTVGGGAIMPGLSQYLSRELGLPVSNLDPWQWMNLGELPPPPPADHSIYITAAGEAMLNPKEIMA